MSQKPVARTSGPWAPASVDQCSTAKECNVDTDIATTPSTVIQCFEREAILIIGNALRAVTSISVD
jgi:hypothetical protein